MTIPRRSFLRVFGSGVGAIACSALATEAQRRSTPDLPSTAKKLLIAHRGASAYAPEHTIQSYQLAFEQGADFVEQDLQVTRDKQLICLHDLSLERTTNVAEVFPTRFREEVVAGKAMHRWYVSDFTLREIKQLDAGSWFKPKFKGAQVPTFQEAIDLVRGKAGLYPETKDPEVYGRLGLDMERLLLESLRKNKLGTRSSERHTPVIIQSFSAESLKKLGALHAKLPLILLVNEAARTRWLTEAGLADVKHFANGIGPAKALVDEHLVTQAHAAGLTVTPYTFRLSDMGHFRSLREEMGYFLYELGVDALFTDNPDLFPRAKLTRQ